MIQARRSPVPCSGAFLTAFCFCFRLRFFSISSIVEGLSSIDHLLNSRSSVSGTANCACLFLSPHHASNSDCAAAIESASYSVAVPVDIPTFQSFRDRRRSFLLLRVSAAFFSLPLASTQLLWRLLDCSITVIDLFCRSNTFVVRGVIAASQLFRIRSLPRFLQRTPRSTLKLFFSNALAHSRDATLCNVRQGLLFVQRSAANA